MKELGQNLVFIVGHYKSGSTWLLNMLSLHPDVRGLLETYIFHHTKNCREAVARTRTLFSDVSWSCGGQRNLIQYRTLNFMRALSATLRIL